MSREIRWNSEVQRSWVLASFKHLIKAAKSSPLSNVGFLKTTKLCIWFCRFENLLKPVPMLYMFFILCSLSFQVVLLHFEIMELWTGFYTFASSQNNSVESEKVSTGTRKMNTPHHISVFLFVCFLLLLNFLSNKSKILQIFFKTPNILYSCFHFGSVLNSLPIHMNNLWL